MKIDLEFVELHSPLFITHDNGGTNFGEKLYIDQKRNLKGHLEALYYDTDLKHTVVIYKGKVALIESVANMTIINPNELGIKVPDQIVKTQTQMPASVTDAIKAQIGGPERFQAQVSTPHDKVQGKPGRKAKFQGEESQGE